MGPSELLSVRLFKQHITEHLPEYSAVDDDKVLKTLQRSLSPNLYDSAEFLKIQLKNNQVDFSQVIEEFVSELADHYVQDPSSSDLIIEQLLKNNYFSFASKVESAKELQLAIQLTERKRLKEILLANDEAQEAEDLRIVFERLERQELKKFLQETEEFSEAAGYAQMSRNYDHTNIAPPPLPPSLKKKNIMGHWLKIAAIFLVILIPAGILLYRNILNHTVPMVAETGEKPEKTEDTQYLASEDISGLLDISLPDVSIKKVISEIDSDLDRGQGYASEDDSKIEIRVVSKSRQMAYLQNKMDTIGRKINQINNQLKQGKVHPKTLNELKVQIEELQTAERNCRNLSEQITKAEMHYEFIKSRLTIYSNKEIDPKRFTVREEINVDTREPEYFLMLDEKEYKKLYLSQTDSIKAQKSSYSRSAYSKFFTDINRGEKLLCFYSPGCEHCVTVAKELNQLKKKASDFPEIRVCFMDEETELIPEFFKNVGAQYPYRILEVADFWETLGSSKDTPAVIYLKNGKVTKEYSGFDNRKFDKVEFGKLIGIK